MAKKQPTAKTLDPLVNRKVHVVPLKDIKPYKNNAKAHSDTQVRQIADSIREFGFNQPIAVDAKNVIVVGHGRYLASRLLGLVRVPVVTLAGLTDKQLATYRLKDNKSNESPWLNDMLRLEAQAIGVDALRDMGFDTKVVIEHKPLKLPDDFDDQTADHAVKASKSVEFSFGRHRFNISHSAYDRWLNELADDGIVANKDIIVWIREKLQLS